MDLNISLGSSHCPAVHMILVSSGGGSLETRLWLANYPKTDIHGVNHPNRCMILEAFFDSMCKYWAGKR